nr:SLBB domain-containing protein [Oceanococcus sp. HetDA_MAG_MS8]
MNRFVDAIAKLGGSSMQRIAGLVVAMVLGLAPLLAWGQASLLNSLSEDQRGALLRDVVPGLQPESTPPPEGAPVVLRQQGDQPERSTNNADQRDGNTGLKPFGYEFFAGVSTTFAPVSDVPIPADYVLGPGDEILLRYTGTEAAEHSLFISRSGSVFLPTIGPLNLAGLRFAEAKVAIQERISAAKLGLQAFVEMGELRNIRVFVAGDVNNPGSYTVSALATMTQALYVSGGVATTGSLRRVLLKRSGNTVSTLDLYELLLNGDSSNDERLQAGDVVFVPPVGATVSVDGAVQRPARYELLGDTSTVTKVIRTAGGPKPGAVQDRVAIERILNGFRQLIPAEQGVDSTAVVQNGDTLRILSAADVNEAAVKLIGPAIWPGSYPVGRQTRFTDIVRSPQDLKPGTDLGFALVLRRIEGGSGLKAVYVNPRQAFANEPGANIRILPGDEVHVFELAPSKNPEEETGPASAGGKNGLAVVDSTVGPAGSIAPQQEVPATLGADGGRPAQLPEPSPAIDNDESGSRQQAESGQRPLKPDTQIVEEETELASRLERMAELADRVTALSTVDRRPAVVSVVGAVRFPGAMPLDNTSARVADVLRAAGGLSFEAEKGFVEITRAPQRVTTDPRADTVIVRLADEQLRTVTIRGGDTVAVRLVPGIQDIRTVDIQGEVLYPGSYAVGRNTTLAQLLQRAGGLSPDAYTPGVVFTRVSLQEKEQKQVDRLKQRLRGDLTTAALTQADDKAFGVEALSAIRTLLDELAAYPAVGRLVIDFDAQLSGNTPSPIVLEDGDTIVIPRRPQSVTVTGEVQFPTSHRWQPGHRAKDFIRLSGGSTRLADEKRGFVVRVNGAVEPLANGIFRPSPRIYPGDVVVVPVDATPIAPITIVSAVTQVISQIAVTLAAFNAVGVL